MLEKYAVLNGVALSVWKEVCQSSRSNNRSFVYLHDKESGVRRESESGVEVTAMIA